MEKSFIQKFIEKIREKTPLPIRHKIGPVIAYIIYVVNIYIRKNRVRPHVLSIIDTIDLIFKKNLSVLRFGDGEIFMLDGGDISFQKKTTELISKLKSIIQVKNPKLLICIPGVWEKLDIFEPYAYWFNMHHIYRHSYMWKKLLSYTQTYGDTNMTRPYLAYKNKDNCENIFKKLFSIWEGKDVVLIEGEKSRLGVGNDMFDNVKSIKRILCPPEDAFSKYDSIKNEAIKVPKNSLILLSLGPTAKVLAYDMFLLGYRVIDIGHIDMEYEMFLRKETKQVKVPYKYFNEIHERNPDDCIDEKYINQIITTIR